MVTPYPVITLQYENKRSGMYCFVVAPAVTVQSEGGDIPLEYVAKKAGATFRMRERAIPGEDMLYQTLEDITQYPALRAKPELWRILVLDTNDLSTVSEICTCESIEIAEATLREVYERAIFAYDGNLVMIPVNDEGSLWLNKPARAK